MKLPDKHDAIGWAFMIPLIVLIWALSGYLLYEIVKAVIW